MKTHRYTALRGLLWFICIYHVACGLAAIVWPEQIPLIAEKIAGMKVSATPEFLYLAKPFGVYAAVFGVMMGVAAWNPIKNRALISIGIALFALRIVQRLLGLDEMERVFAVSPGRSLQTVAIVAVLGLALGWFRYRLYADMHGAETEHPG